MMEIIIPWSHLASRILQRERRCQKCCGYQNDVFGLSEGFLDLTTANQIQDEMSEVLTSHIFLGAHREADGTSDPEDFAEQVLRLRPRNKETGERQGDLVTTTVGILLEGLARHLIVHRKLLHGARKRKRNETSQNEREWEKKWIENEAKYRSRPLVPYASMRFN